MISNYRKRHNLHRKCDKKILLPSPFNLQPPYELRQYSPDSKNRSKRKLKPCLKQKRRRLKQQKQRRSCHGGQQIIRPSHLICSKLKPNHHNCTNHAGRSTCQHSITDCKPKRGRSRNAKTNPPFSQKMIKP